MLDIKELRRDPHAIKTALEKKHYQFDTDTFTQLEAKRKAIQTEAETLQQERNSQSKLIGKAKAQGEDIAPLLALVDKLKKDYATKQHDLQTVQSEFDEFLLDVPNIPADDVPFGKDESENKEIKRWGNEPRFDFEPKDHVDLAGDSLDFERGAKITGARFVVMKQEIARLHRALISFMLDEHIGQGYQEVNVPYIVNYDSLYGTGQLPNKFEEDLFKLEDERRLYLIPTAEVPVTNIHRDEILDAKDLPIKYVCHSPCFRAEAGSYGRDTRGMIRQHQFEKVELVQLVTPEEGDDALESLTLSAESILEKLELHYRRVLLCGGDMSRTSYRTFDLEVWLPSQRKFREISSCSLFHDYQARRLKTRFRSGTAKPELVHTINGSGLAIGRTLLAVLENYQQADGSVLVPKVLQQAMGAERILAPT